MERMCVRSGWPSTARVRGAPGGVSRESRAQRVEVRAGVDVEQQRRHALHATGHAGGVRERAVAFAAVRPEAGGDRVRRRQQQAVGAGAVPVGHDHHVRLVVGAAASC